MSLKILCSGKFHTAFISSVFAEDIINSAYFRAASLNTRHFIKYCVDLRIFIQFETFKSVIFLVLSKIPIEALIRFN